MHKYIVTLSFVAFTSSAIALENFTQVSKPEDFTNARQLIWEHDNGKQFAYQDNFEGSRTLYPQTNKHVIDITNFVTASSPNAAESAVHGSFFHEEFFYYLGEKSVPILWTRAKHETCRSASDAQIVLSFTEPLKSVGAYVSILSHADYSSGSAAFIAKMWYRLKNSNTWILIQGGSSVPIVTDGFRVYRNDAPFLGVSVVPTASGIEEVRFCANYIDSTVDRKSHKMAISRLYFE